MSSFNKDYIKNRIGYVRFINSVERAKAKKLARRIEYENYLKLKKEFAGEISYEKMLESWLPPNVSYLLNCEKSCFSINKISKNVPKNGGVFLVPKEFSLIDYPEESYKFLSEVTAALITQAYSHIKIDYSKCKRVDLGAQVFFDIILKDIILFFKRYDSRTIGGLKVKHIEGVNVFDKNVAKLLFSVGSPTIHTNKMIFYKDIIPYKLCIHDRESNRDPIKIIEQKDIDTTTLVDYVLECLRRLGKTLTPEKLDNLCTVIGEILINAEEHSSTKYRFSIGYFHEKNENGNHFGVFRLAILNFGKTIYEKFKDPDCPNSDIVKKMMKLSENYTKKRFFFSKAFEEETLWTLYALQDGVTSVAPEKYKRRGHGTIQFIESFFNIKQVREVDSYSRMTILSGNTCINFDGSYKMIEREIENEKFKFMTFNKSGNIEDKPDEKFVKFVDSYFPGTLISARILFNEDDLTNEIE